MIEQIPDDIVVVETPDKVEYEVRVVVGVVAECSQGAASCWDKTLIQTKLFIADQQGFRNVTRPDEKILILDVFIRYLKNLWKDTEI